MRTFLESVYVAVSIVPAAVLGSVILETEGSLVSGIAIGSVVPLLAAISLVLTLVGILLSVLAYRHKRRLWHLVLGTVLSSPLALLLGVSWLF